MRAFKLIGLSLLVLLAVVIAAAGVLYLLACKVPGNYHPEHPDLPGRRVAAAGFYKRILQFYNLAQQNDPYQWEVSQKELNEYLGSMDQIADKWGEDPTVPYEQMNRAGVTDPAVALDDGVLTIMFRATDYDKVISLDVSFELKPGRKLLVRLDQVRVGVLPIPSSFVKAHIAELKESLAKRTAKADPPPADARRSPGGVSYDEVAAVVSTVARAIDAEPISTEIKWTGRKKRVRVDGIYIDDGLLVLDVVPIGRKRPPDE